MCWASDEAACDAARIDEDEARANAGQEPPEPSCMECAHFCDSGWVDESVPPALADALAGGYGICIVDPCDPCLCRAEGCGPCCGSDFEAWR